MILNDMIIKCARVYVLFQKICIKIEDSKYYKLQSGERNLTQQFGARIITTITIGMQEQRWYLILAARLQDHDGAHLPQGTSKALLRVYHPG